jgi:hypothetical protein
MALTKEEKTLLEELSAKANAPDEDDWEVEIYEPGGHGARMPVSKANDWLYKTFGIGNGPVVEEAPTEEPVVRQPVTKSRFNTKK